MSEPEKASENSRSDETEKNLRNLSAAAAMMRYAPDLFDQEVEKLTKDPKRLRDLAAIVPAKLTAEEMAQAMAKAMAKVEELQIRELQLDLRGIADYMRANSCDSPGEALNDMLCKAMKPLRGADGYIDKRNHPLLAQLDTLWQVEAKMKHEARLEAKTHREPRRAK